MYTMMRITFFDGNGLDYVYSLSVEKKLLFFMAMVYLCITAFGVLNGLVGVFGSAISEVGDDVLGQPSNVSSRIKPPPKNLDDDEIDDDNDTDHIDRKLRPLFSCMYCCLSAKDQTVAIVEETLVAGRSSIQQINFSGTNSSGSTNNTTTNNTTTASGNAATTGTTDNVMVNNDNNVILDENTLPSPSDNDIKNSTDPAITNQSQKGTKASGAPTTPQQNRQNSTQAGKNQNTTMSTGDVEMSTHQASSTPSLQSSSPSSLYPAIDNHSALDKSQEESTVNTTNNDNHTSKRLFLRRNTAARDTAHNATVADNAALYNIQQQIAQLGGIIQMQSSAINDRMERLEASFDRRMNQLEGHVAQSLRDIEYIRITAGNTSNNNQV